MKLPYAFFAVVNCCLAVAQGVEEFGREVGVKSKPLVPRRKSKPLWDEQYMLKESQRLTYDDILEHFLDEEIIVQMAMSFSMSMSLSLAPAAAPVFGPNTMAPSIPPTMLLPSASFAPTQPTTNSPTANISFNPVTQQPTENDPATQQPTKSPSNAPTDQPFSQPTSTPSPTTTQQPTKSPSSNGLASNAPTDEPFSQPTSTPSPTTTQEPTKSPSSNGLATNAPTDEPFSQPTSTPSPTTTQHPTKNPSSNGLATNAPTDEPFSQPTSTPSPTTTQQPTKNPSSNGLATNAPTDEPFSQPTSTPSPTTTPPPTTTAPPTSTSSPTTTPPPTSVDSGVPTQFVSIPPSNHPTSSDTFSPQPSTVISPFPTIGPPFSPPSISPAPSQAPSYSPSGDNPELAFDCVENGVLSLGLASDSNTTAVYLFLGYLVESTSNSTDVYIDQLEQTLLLTAVAAALGCDRPSDRRSLLEASKRIYTESTVVDSTPCEPTLEAAESCNVIETDLVFFLKGDFDPDRAAYAGYAAIKDKMTNDGYIGAIETVLKLVYLSPLPIPAPPQATDGDTGNPNTVITAGGKNLSVSPWTIGACVASIFGGVLSMFIWSRNRRNRHRRHMQLVEDGSLIEHSSRNPLSV